MIIYKPKSREKAVPERLANTLWTTFQQEPDSSRFAQATQKGDFLIRSQIIELHMGRNKNESSKGTLILDMNNIGAFKLLVEGATRRREEAQTEEELNLLTKLEDLEDTIDENSNEIEDIKYSIK